METQGYGKRPLWQWVAIYLVVGGLVYGLIYYFMYAKNGGYNTGENGYDYGATTPADSGQVNPYVTGESAANKTTVTLKTLNDSGQSGTATLEEINGKTVVTVALTGYLTDGTAQPAHIHVGTCPGVGTVKYPLTSLTNGTSTTTLDVTLAQMKSEFPLALNVHKSAKDVSVYTACGDLSW